MSTSEPPRVGAAGPPPAPVAVQQTTVIQVGTHKSVVGAVLLALLFGPLGMLYATVSGAIVMFFISIIVAIPTLGLGLILTTPIGALWAGLAADSQNKRLQAVAVQQATGGQPAISVAPPAPPAPMSPAEPEPATDVIEAGAEEVNVVLKSRASTPTSCDSCGHDLKPGARFCSACGASQATT